MDPMFATAALASAEKIINAALAYDPSSRIALEQLAPNVLAVEVSAPDFKVFVVPTSEGIQLRGQYEGEITTHIQGSLAALIRLSASDQINLKDSGVQLAGSTHFLAELKRILKNVDIDWEEMLSQLFGDIIGHQSAEIIRGKMNWAKDRATNIQRLTSEFLTQELKILPSKPEIAFFNSQVDELRLGADRAAARIEQILARIARHDSQ